MKVSCILTIGAGFVLCTVEAFNLPALPAHTITRAPPVYIWGLPSSRSGSQQRVVRTPLSCSSETVDAKEKENESVGGRGDGHGHGHGMMMKGDPNSFVQQEMRSVAMKLHTKDQAREGEQENKKGSKFSDWKPTRAGYLQFLLDSYEVYSAFDKIVESNDDLAPFRSTGLERTTALKKDIDWLLREYPELSLPKPTEKALNYASFLTELADRSVPAFVCHFYNHYFAHTAGGIMIGKKVADICLDGHTLDFYKWDGNVRELLDEVRKSIDAMADGWSREQKNECLEETQRTFMYGGSLLSSVTS